MRLFVAIEIPKEVRAAVASLLNEFRALSPQTKWVRAENMHLTLKFLGETDAAKLSEVKSALVSIHSTQPVMLQFRGLSFFPYAKGPRVFWASIQSTSDLASLAGEIDNAMHKLGFPLESRPFVPHLTLARFNEPRQAAALRNAVVEKASRSIGSFSAREFHLIESKLKSTGAEYATLQTFEFAAGNE